MYQRVEAVPQDYGEAVRWCRKAAQQGSALAGPASFSDPVANERGESNGSPQLPPGEADDLKAAAEEIIFVLENF